MSTTWLVDETCVRILGKWHYLYRGVELDGQVLDCWLSRTRDLPAAEAFFRRTISSTGCPPERVVTGHVLPIRHPHMCAGREPYRDRFLQPGDLDQPLRAELASPATNTGGRHHLRENPR